MHSETQSCFRVSQGFIGRASRESRVLDGGKTVQEAWELPQEANNATSSHSWKSEFMAVWKVAGAFVRPNGMTRNSNVPYRDVNAVLCSSPCLIGI